jgi:hypothetical protein
MLRLSESGAKPADAFARQAPDDRIDIVRSIWNDQMRASTRIVDGLERSR